MPKQSPSKSVVLSVRVPVEIGEALQTLADAFGISRNALATQILTMGFHIGEDLGKEAVSKAVEKERSSDGK